MLTCGTELMQVGALQRITVEISDEVATSVGERVKADGYECADQYVEEALRGWLSIQDSPELRLAWLRQAVDEGDRSGPGIPADEVFAELNKIIASYETE